MQSFACHILGQSISLALIESLRLAQACPIIVAKTPCYERNCSSHQQKTRKLLLSEITFMSFQTHLWLSASNLILRKAPKTVRRRLLAVLSFIP